MFNKISWDTDFFIRPVLSNFFYLCALCGFIHVPVQNIVSYTGVSVIIKEYMCGVHSEVDFLDLHENLCEQTKLLGRESYRRES